MLLTLAACTSPAPAPNPITTEAQTEAPEQYFEITEDTVIVRADESEDALEAMKLIRTAIEQIYGFTLSFCTDFLMDDEQPAPSEILVGKTNREVAAELYAPLTYADFGYRVISSGTVAVAGGGPESTVKGEIDLSTSAEGIEGYAFNEIETYNLVYQSTTDEQKVCAGVKRYTRHYTDRGGNPTRVYVIECAPGSVKPVLGTKDSKYAITGTQSILKQIEAEVDRTGVDICAAVNGCLYRRNGDKIEPFGMCVKDGRIVTDLQREGYAIFAVMKDGSYFFGYPTAGNVNIANIDQAVSGAYMLIDDGVLTDMGLTSHDPSFAHIRHPRTAIGVKEDGTLFFVVVDGRQAGFSLGATLPNLALIFRELGCVNAVNIDGGGSSISYTKNDKTGEYVMWNKPSDGAPRSVINCMLLVRNEAYRED